MTGLLLTVGGTTVSFPSDTHFLEHRESIDADVFIPPIGGHYTMNRRETATVARTIGSELVLPFTVTRSIRSKLHVR